MFTDVYDDNLRHYLVGVVSLVQRYESVSMQQAQNIVKSNIDAFEDCYHDGMTEMEAYNEYAGVAM